MIKYSQYFIEQAESDFVSINESLSREIKIMIDKNIKKPAERAMIEVKKRLIHMFSPKIKAWGLANSNMLNIDKKFGGVIKQAINEPEKMIAKIFDKALKNGDLNI